MPKISTFTFTEQNVRNPWPPDQDDVQPSSKRKRGAQAKQYQRRDPSKPGLLLRVYPSGKKSWLAELERNVLRAVGDAKKLTPKEAWTKAREMQTDHANGRLVETKRIKALTLGGFLEEQYREHARSNCKTPERGDELVARLKSCCGSLVEKRLDELSEIAIQAWVRRRKKAVKATTARRDLGALKTALNHAVKIQLLNTNPAGDVHVKVESDPRVRFLSPQERLRLQEALSGRDTQLQAQRASGNAWRRRRGLSELPRVQGYADYLHPLVLLVMNTGLRKSEALSLTWDNVSLEGALPRLAVRAAHAKTAKTRHVPLNTQAVAVLKRWKSQSDGKGLVFPNPVTGERMKDVRTAWESLLVDAKISDFRFHDLRHDFASQLVMGGVDLYRVKDLLGHGSIEMTQRYSHLSDEALAEAVEVLA